MTVKLTWTVRARNKDLQHFIERAIDIRYSIHQILNNNSFNIIDKSSSWENPEHLIFAKK